MSLETFLKKSKTVLVIGLFFKLQTTTVHHVVIKLLRNPLAKVLQLSLQLLNLDVLVLLVLVASRESLPRQTALDKIKQHVTNSFEVIPSTLLLAFVGVQRCIPGGACEVLSVAVRYVLPIRGLVVLGQAEVNHVEGVLVVVLSANEEVVRLDIAVDYALFVALLDALNHLQRHHAAGLQIKLVTTRLKQVL